MRTTSDVLTHLKDLGVKLWVEDERLRFNAPKGVMTSALKDLLRTRKQELLDFLPKNDSGSEHRIRPVPRDREHPLSYSQQRLWFLHQIEGVGSAYNIASLLVLEGPLAVSLLERGLDEIARRHESLNVVFALDEGRTVQRPRAFRPVPRVVVDFQGLSRPTTETETERLVRIEKIAVFDLAEGPLLRVRLFRLTGRRHLLLVNMHHIVSDAWSMGILVRELVAYYRGFLERMPVQLPPLPIQYIDFAHWQRQRLGGSGLETDMRFWRQALAGAPALITLPTDRPRPPTQTFRGDNVNTRLDAAGTGALNRLSQDNGATLFMTLQAVFSILLSRYSGQDSVVLGSVSANRNPPETEPLIGFFVNTLVFHNKLSGNPSFREFLDRVRGVTLATHRHQHVPFEQVVERLQPERNFSHTPIFQVMFVLQNVRAEPLSLPGIAVAEMGVPNRSAKFDLNLLVSPDRGGLYLSLEYNTDLFKRETIARMADHLKELLASVTAHPGQRVKNLPLVAPEERARVLDEWNATRTAYPHRHCLHQWFESRAAAVPDRVAVWCGTRGLGYGTLDRAANGLARHLIGKGIRPGDLVGVCMLRSEAMAAALLGILKAGAAYVPMNHDFPRDRIRFILKDTGASLLLTHRQLVPGLEGLGSEACPIDPLPSWDCNESLPHVRVDADHLAYLIFTSGSTGKPKGVVLQHRPVTNLIHWVNTRFEVSARDRLLFTTSLCFDLSVYDLFGILAGGGTVSVADEGEVNEPSRLTDHLVRRCITFWDSAPAALQQLTPFLEQASPGRHLRLAFLSGDWVPLSLPPTVQRGFPACRVIALGGATEAAIWSNFFPVTELRPEWQSIPYGVPIQNAKYFVLSEVLELAPVRVEGDLLIGGSVLSSGYHRLPALTAERYIPDPFSRRPGRILYRTGDRARWFADGNIEFLGRLDHQVKIRGFRIELGEIRAVLKDHPKVREALVTVREDRPGDRRLVAYAQLAARTDAPNTGDSGALAGEFRAFLQDKLPEYMLPAAFLVVETFPVTANGKVDYKALPAPEWKPGPRAEEAGAPRTPLQETLLLIWRRVLGLERIGMNDDFFELGGHSLLVTQVVAQVKRLCSLDLPIQALFENPTIARLAQIMESVLRSGATDTEPKLVPAVSGDRVPLSFSQQRLWFIEQLAPRSPAYNIYTALELAGPLGITALDRSLNGLAGRQQSLRTVFVTENGLPVQQILPQETAAFTLIDVRGMPAGMQEKTLRMIADNASNHLFDLENGPLFHALLVRLAKERHGFLIAMHHIVSDGWSMAILFRELMQGYAFHLLGRGTPPAGPAVQYVDFAIWQQQWLRGEALQRRLDFWRAQLAGIPPLLTLPWDRKRPERPMNRGSRVEVRSPGSLGQELAKWSLSQGATPFMTLLSAFYLLLARYSGQEDVAVGVPNANRNRPEIQGLIGFFVNTLVLRTDLHGATSFLDLVRQVRQTALAAFAHQDLPFEKIVEALQPDRRLNQSPLFQVFFDFQQAEGPSETPPGIALKPMAMTNETAKFDLNLTLGMSRSGLYGFFEFNRELFDRSTILRFSRHYGSLLMAALQSPEVPLPRLFELPSGEKASMLREWNDTCCQHPRPRLLHAPFLARFPLCPDAAALIFRDRCLSYRFLAEKARALAQRLRELGLGPDRLAGLYFSREPEMAIAMLATLQAGAGFVPLDPGLPPQRLATIAADASLDAVLVGSKKNAEECSGLTQSRAPVVDVREEFDDTEVCGWQERQGHPLQTAYVIYTSGSTGKPKGVQVPHQGIFNRIAWMERVFPLAPTDKLLQKTPFVFDASVWELFAPLWAGASEVLAEPDGHRDPLYLLQTMAAHGITRLQVVPSQLAMLLESGPWRDLACLKTVFSGGEALPLGLRQNYRKAHGGKLVNLYGPTEASIDVAYRPFSGTDREDAILIGRPIDNTGIYPVDRAMRLLPIGVPGELLARGQGLARGYLGLPRLTARRFVPDPFGQQPGERLYRTGDLGRLRSEGEIEYLGRTDTQVKLRGYRIELGEIEAVLERHPSVARAAVTVREDQPGTPTLAAYIQVAEGLKKGETGAKESGNRKGAGLIAELQRTLSQKLPAYMVPGTWTPMQGFPTTASGKLDRKALPRPETAGQPKAASMADPRNTLEWELLRLGADILGHSGFGVRDNFFLVGGHSMLAVRLMAEIRKKYGRTVPLTRFFQNPTVEGLAAELSHSGGQRRWSPVTAYRDRGHLPTLFICPPLAGNALPYTGLAKRLHGERPFYGLQLPGLDGEREPLNSVEDQAAFLVDAVLEVQKEGPFHLAGWSSGGMIAFEMAHRMAEHGHAVGALILVDAGGPGGTEESALESFAAQADVSRFIAILKEGFGFELRMNRDEEKDPSLDSVLTAGLQEAKEKGLMPPEVDRDQLHQFLRVIRANQDAIGNYRPRPYRGPVVHLVAEEKLSEESPDPVAAWKPWTLGEVKVDRVPGHHRSLIAEPHVAVLAQKIEAYLPSQ